MSHARLSFRCALPKYFFRPGSSSIQITALSMLAAARMWHGSYTWTSDKYRGSISEALLPSLGRILWVH
eukprot:3015228-Pyramimonas_sp.AAC.1